jgi:hypothetical protein
MFTSVTGFSPGGVIVTLISLPSMCMCGMTECSRQSSCTSSTPFTLCFDPAGTQRNSPRSTNAFQGLTSGFLAKYRPILVRSFSVRPVRW